MNPKPYRINVYAKSGENKGNCIDHLYADSIESARHLAKITSFDTEKYHPLNSTIFEYRYVEYEDMYEYCYLEG